LLKAYASTLLQTLRKRESELKEGLLRKKVTASLNVKGAAAGGSEGVKEEDA
jgi:hypothetical protein